MAVELIVVGASWGGLHAMSQLLAGLPEDFEPPIALAQHRAPQAPDLLVASLQRTTARPVREAEDKDPVEAGVVYVARYEGAQFDRTLADGVVFAQHNLASDAAFNEFHVIMCRNVMIYFGRALQDRVHALLHESLAMFGFLALGRKESIRFTRHEASYQDLDAREKLYRKVA